MRKPWLALLVALALASAATADDTRPAPDRAAPTREESVDFRRLNVPVLSSDAVLPSVERATAVRTEAPAFRLLTLPADLPQETPTETRETTRPTAPGRAAGHVPPGAVEVSHSMHFFHDEYIAFRAGPYWGAGSKNKVDTGFFGEIEFGHQIDESAAVQLQVGLLEGDDTTRGVKTEVSSMPIMIGGTGEWAIDRAELFFGASVGIAITEVRTKTGAGSESDTKNMYAGSLRLGARYWATDDLFVGVDGLYIFSTTRKYEGVSTDIDGFAVMLGFGLGF